MDEWMDGWIDGSMDWWMDGWIDRQTDKIVVIGPRQNILFLLLKEIYMKNSARVTAN